MYAFVVKQQPLTQTLLEHQSLFEQVAPADTLFLVPQTPLKLRKWVSAQRLQRPPASHSKHPEAWALLAQQRPPKQAALAHQMLVLQTIPVPWMLFGMQVCSSTLWKWEAVLQELHFPVDSAHARQPEAKAVDAQQRSPTQEVLVHSSPAEQEVPAVFFGEHLDSASRK